LKQPLFSEKATPEVAFSIPAAFCFFVNRLLDAESWARERLARFPGETIELALPPRLRVTVPRGRPAAWRGDANLLPKAERERWIAPAWRGGSARRDQRQRAPRRR
jgi:hypothetical protein